MSAADPQRWNDDRVTVLRDMWTDGYSASQIAAVLGGGITRLAVIGKVSRMKLNHGARRTDAESRAVPAKRSKSNNNGKGLAFKIAKARQEGLSGPSAMAAVLGRSVAAPDALPPEDDAPASVVALVDLRESSCRWPYGDPRQPGFGFCGKGATRGRYCEQHAARAYAGLSALHG